VRNDFRLLMLFFCTFTKVPVHVLSIQMVFFSVSMCPYGTGKFVLLKAAGFVSQRTFLNYFSLCE